MKVDKVMSLVFTIMISCFVITYLLLLRFANINEQNIKISMEAINANNASIVLIDKKIDRIVKYLDIKAAQTDKVEKDVEVLKNSSNNR